MDKQIRLGKLLTNTEILILAFALISRIVLFFGTYLVVVNRFPSLNISSFSQFINVYGKRWDGNSYTFIAQNGYITEGSERHFIVFPPLYPLTIKVLSLVLPNYVLSGVLISNLFFILSCLLFFKLVKKIYRKKTAVLATVLLAIFPTSYFFSIAYPESMFFFLATACFYLLEKKRYVASSLVAGLASITKPFGIILFLIVIYRTLKDGPGFKKVLFVLNCLGIFPFIYLWLNYLVYGDFFAFQKSLADNWQKHFVPPWAGIIDSWKRGLLTAEWSEYKIMVGFAEAIASSTAVVFSFLSIRKLRTEHFLYLLLGTLLFTSTGFILSAPRYLLSLPPFFIILTVLLRNKLLRTIWITISICLLLYLSSTIASGRWAF